MKLWQKHWQLDKAIEAFETKDDLLLDGHLVRADVIGSLAQAHGLVKIGLLTKDEFASLKSGLNEILRLWEQGEFALEAGDEDVHTKIENWLTEHVGEAGKKIHTGRSRNDQVATAIRIYTKEQLHDIISSVLMLAHEFLAFARRYEWVPMPGYTHMQKAMPSSVGMWAGSFAEGFLDSLRTLEAAYGLNDQSPLGSAAGYGVPIPHDRVYTAGIMGFSRVQNNSLYCQNARGVIEAAVVGACISILQQLSKFASDVLLFTTKEFDIFHVADELCSGSSIMPQKRNVDVAELVRSKVHVVLGHYNGLVGISANLISGYNRDLQDTKKPLFESLWITHDTVRASHQLLRGLAPNPLRLREMMSGELYFTHNALTQVMDGIAFRDAYKKVGSGREGYTSAVETDRITDTLHQSTHMGGTANLGLSQVGYVLGGKIRQWEKRVATYDKCVALLLTGDMV